MNPATFGTDILHKLQQTISERNPMNPQDKIKELESQIVKRNAVISEQAIEIIVLNKDIITALAEQLRLKEQLEYERIIAKQNGGR